MSKPRKDGVAPKHREQAKRTVQICFKVGESTRDKILKLAGTRSYGEWIEDMLRLQK